MLYTGVFSLRVSFAILHLQTVRFILNSPKEGVFLVHDLSKVNLIKYSVNQDEWKLKYNIFSFFFLLSYNLAKK